MHKLKTLELSERLALVVKGQQFITETGHRVWFDNETLDFMITGVFFSRRLAEEEKAIYDNQWYYAQE